MKIKKLRRKLADFPDEAKVVFVEDDGAWTDEAEVRAATGDERHPSNGKADVVIRVRR